MAVFVVATYEEQLIHFVAETRRKGIFSVEQSVFQSKTYLSWIGIGKLEFLFFLFLRFICSV